MEAVDHVNILKKIQQAQGKDDTIEDTTSPRKWGSLMQKN